MLYLVLILVTLTMCLIGMFKGLAQNMRDFAGDRSIRGKQWQRYGFPLVTGIAALLMGLPLLLTVLAADRLGQGGLSPSDAAVYGQWSIAGLVLGAVLFVGLALVEFLQVRKSPQGKSFARIGAVVVFVGCAFVSGMTVLSHYTWFKSDADGWANLAGIRMMRPITDMDDCNADVVLLHWEHGKPAKYRCPTVMVLNGYSSRPLIVWPDFKDGTSAQLAAAYEELKAGAQKGPTNDTDNNSAAQ